MKRDPARSETTAYLPTPTERESLRKSAIHDAKQAIECMEAGDWNRAETLLHLAVIGIESAFAGLADGDPM